MAEYAQLKAAINAVIKQNGRMEITGEVLNQVLTAMVNSLGRSMGCAGVATPATNPQSPDQNLFYFAVQAGTYVNFNSIVLPAGISVLMWNGTWTAQTWFIIKDTPEYQSTDFISAGGVFDSQKVDGNAYDISEHFPTGGVNNTNEYTLQGALVKIPENMKKAGMAIKFKESTTHNYMVFTHIGSDATNFTSVNLWQSFANSNELFHSPTAFMRKQIPTIGAVLDEFGTQNVQTLPTPSNATMNRIYVVQSKHPETDNIKTEWITIKVGNNYQWECIGGDTTGIYDLSDAMAENGEPATYGSLTDAIAAVPADKKRAGMTLAFIGQYADMYSVSCGESTDNVPGAIEIDEPVLYGDGNYRLSALNEMFYSMSGDPILYPSQVGRSINLYCYNRSTKLYVLSNVTLLGNQRVYEQYRFVGTDINDFADESLWEKAKKNPTENTQLTNYRNYLTLYAIEALKPDWENMQNVTWDELVELRDNDLLVAGKFYRITDYVCTTTQEETDAAGNAFDIIVMALHKGRLSERAWAINNENDGGYFDGCNLAAWQLWYCLDNDTNRFAWVDGENGKGVIYRMIDEWGNDCPYDFKNIQFRRTACEIVEGEDVYVAINGLRVGYENAKLPNQDDTKDGYLYTFTHFETYNGEAEDMSLNGTAKNNAIESSHDGTIELPNVVLTNLINDDFIYDNFIGNEVRRITAFCPKNISAKNAYIEDSYFLGVTERCNFDGCRIESCLFNGVLGRTNFINASISAATFKGRIETSDFTSSDISGSIFDVEADGMIMKSAILSSVRMNAEINISDFSGCSMDDVEYLDGIALYNNDFSNCNLSSCSFSATEVDYCNFKGAYLGNVNFHGNMNYCTFSWMEYVEIGVSLAQNDMVQYVTQIGKVSGTAGSYANPPLQENTDYVQILTCDAQSNVVVRTPYI